MTDEDRDTYYRIDIATGVATALITWPTTSAFFDFRLSADGQYLVFHAIPASSPNIARLYSLPTSGGSLQILSPDINPVIPPPSYAISPDGQNVAFAYALDEPSPNVWSWTMFVSATRDSAGATTVLNDYARCVAFAPCSGLNIRFDAASERFGVLSSTQGTDPATQFNLWSVPADGSTGGALLSAVVTSDQWDLVEGASGPVALVGRNDEVYAYPLSAASPTNLTQQIPDPADFAFFSTATNRAIIRADGGGFSTYYASELNGAGPLVPLSGENPFSFEDDCNVTFATQDIRMPVMTADQRHAIVCETQRIFVPPAAFLRREVLNRVDLGSGATVLIDSISWTEGASERPIFTRFTPSGADPQILSLSKAPEDPGPVDTYHAAIDVLFLNGFGVPD